MKVIKTRKNLVWIFVCGFFIGIVLEILLIEKGKFNQSQYKFKHDGLVDEVQITCLVLQKHQHDKYLNSSKKTWLKHCDKYFIVNIKRFQKFMKSKLSETSRSDFQNFLKNATHSQGKKKVENEMEIVAKSAWGGLCKALHQTKSSLRHWLIIVPDSVLVIIENLKLLVKNLNCKDDHYFGYALENLNANYNILSAGILLSHGTVVKLLKKFQSEEDCESTGKYWKNEDRFLGQYLKNLGIFPKDTRDHEGRGRFHGVNLNNVLWPGKLFLKSEYSRKALYPTMKGFKCCSPSMITIDVSDPDSMLILYFYLYKITTVHKEIPKQIKAENSVGNFWKEFLAKEGYSKSAIENMTSDEYFRIWEKKLPFDTVYQEIQNFLIVNKKLMD